MKEHSKGDALIVQGKESEWFYIIMEGEVELMYSQEISSSKHTSTTTDRTDRRYENFSGQKKTTHTCALQILSNGCPVGTEQLIEGHSGVLSHSAVVVSERARLMAINVKNSIPRF